MVDVDAVEVEEDGPDQEHLVDEALPLFVEHRHPQREVVILCARQVPPQFGSRAFDLHRDPVVERLRRRRPRAHGSLAHRVQYLQRLGRLLWRPRLYRTHSPYERDDALRRIVTRFERCPSYSIISCQSLPAPCDDQTHAWLSGQASSIHSYPKWIQSSASTSSSSSESMSMSMMSSSSVSVSMSETAPTSDGSGTIARTTLIKHSRRSTACSSSEEARSSTPRECNRVQSAHTKKWGASCLHFCTSPPIFCHTCICIMRLCCYDTAIAHDGLGSDVLCII